MAEVVYLGKAEANFDTDPTEVTYQTGQVLPSREVRLEGFLFPVDPTLDEFTPVLEHGRVVGLVATSEPPSLFPVLDAPNVTFDRTEGDATKPYSLAPQESAPTIPGVRVNAQYVGVTNILLFSPGFLNDLITNFPTHFVDLGSPNVGVLGMRVHFLDNSLENPLLRNQSRNILSGKQAGRSSTLADPALGPGASTLNDPPLGLTTFSVSMAGPAGATATVSAFALGTATISGLTGMTIDAITGTISFTAGGNVANHGTFVITNFIDPTSVDVANPAGVVNAGNMTWSYNGSGSMVLEESDDDVLYTPVYTINFPIVSPLVAEVNITKKYTRLNRLSGLANVTATVTSTYDQLILESNLPTSPGPGVGTSEMFEITGQELHRNTPNIEVILG